MKKGQLQKAIQAMVGSTTPPPDMGAMGAPPTAAPVAPPQPPMKPKGKSSKGKAFRFTK